MDTSTTVAPSPDADSVSLEGLTPEQDALLQRRHPDLYNALIAPPAPAPEEADG